MRILLLILATLTTYAGPLEASAPGASARLSLGLSGTEFASGTDPLLARAGTAGAQSVMVAVNWRRVAPQRPPGFVAEDPASAGYDFRAVDEQVRAAAGAGLAVVLYVSYAPDWALGPGKRKQEFPGTWLPNPGHFGKFATAVARRYSGTFADPLTPGAVLPKASAFQAWTEPNLESHLAPQWSGRGDRTHTGPRHYRKLLNAFYAGVKSVTPQALVVTAGTAPFGDPGRGEARTPPAAFWREALCLRGRALKKQKCSNPARFDVLAHHPYSVGGPGRKALNVDDVSIPDLHKLTRIVRRAVATGRALPKKRKRLWVTEFSWDTRPPDPDGVPAARHARWISEAFYRFWRQGTDTIMWYRLDDQRGQFNSTYQSGLFLADGGAKPALRAYQFPVYARRRGSRTFVWTRAPAAGSLQVQRSTSSGWRTVATVPVAAGSVRDVRIPTARGSVRAVLGDRVSVATRP